MAVVVAARVTAFNVMMVIRISDGDQDGDTIATGHYPSARQLEYPHCNYSYNPTHPMSRNAAGMLQAVTQLHYSHILPVFQHDIAAN